MRRAPRVRQGDRRHLLRIVQSADIVEPQSARWLFGGILVFHKYKLPIGGRIRMVNVQTPRRDAIQWIKRFDLLAGFERLPIEEDRKSTRLSSSHQLIS